MKKRIYLYIIAAAFALFGCTENVHAQKYLGGDISLLPDYESHNANYMDENGNSIDDMLAFFKQKGWNSMRVRLFVAPSQASQAHKDQGVRQDLEYVKALGKRIKDAGLKFMLDFHYSDTWTDPGQHSTPSAWNSSDTTTLANYVYTYTKECLQALKDFGATPDFIQTGNEITYGMMWPTGHCYPDGGNYSNGTFANFAKYLKAGIKACREECPQAKIIIQTEMSKVQNVTNFYNTLKRYTNDYDIIGISFYPHYHGPLNFLENVINSLEQTHADKKIEIVETGYYHKWYPSDAKYNLTNLYPATDEGQRLFTAALVEMLNAHSSVDGLYWWFPEANEYGINWQNAVTPSGWYNASLWDNETGKVLAAINEMRDFIGDENSIVVPFSTKEHTTAVYDISGRMLSALEPLNRGIYISNGKKFIVK